MNLSVVVIILGLLVLSFGIYFFAYTYGKRDECVYAFQDRCAVSDFAIALFVSLYVICGFGMILTLAGLLLNVATTSKLVKKDPG